MAILRSFSAQTTVSALLDIANSVGSHTGAKLQAFASDERTLTDEFCDMTCIWATQSRGVMAGSGVWGFPIRLDIHKVSAQAEVVVGADLELIVRSPLGAKRLVAQAKVLDPQDLKLRCDSIAGWDKLRDQLAKCRNTAGPMAYLLVYVPESELSGRRYQFGTWEQQYSAPGSGVDLRFGTSFIRVSDLLDAHDQWLLSPPVQYLGGGRFNPPTLSYARVLFELLSCSVGNWSEIPPPERRVRISEEESQNTNTYRMLDVQVSGIEVETWNEVLVPHFRELVGRLRSGDDSA